MPRARRAPYRADHDRGTEDRGTDEVYYENTVGPTSAPGPSTRASARMFTGASGRMREDCPRAREQDPPPAELSGDEAAQNSPTVRPCSSISTWYAAACLVRPGICWMFPASGTSQPAPV